MKLVVELGIPELTTEQIETLCSTAENAARKYVLSKVSSKMVDRLDISVEAAGSKPVNVTVEVDLELTPKLKALTQKSWLKKPQMKLIKLLKNT